jgi:anti-anti-sigma factor
MTSTFTQTNDAIYIETGKLSELVRGQDHALLERLAPLVRRHNVSLDLGHVQRMDAAGIAALISLYGCARDAGRSFSVVNASPRVAEILALVGLDRILLSHNMVINSQCRPCADRPAA